MYGILLWMETRVINLSTHCLTPSYHPSFHPSFLPSFGLPSCHPSFLLSLASSPSVSFHPSLHLFILPSIPPASFLIPSCSLSPIPLASSLPSFPSSYSFPILSRSLPAASLPSFISHSSLPSISLVNISRQWGRRSTFPLMLGCRWAAVPMCIADSEHNVILL